MDATTEAIAHFIGYFDRLLEEARLRTIHDEFPRAVAQDPALGALEAAPLLLKTGYRIPDYDPELSLKSRAERIEPAVERHPAAGGPEAALAIGGGPSEYGSIAPQPALPSLPAVTIHQSAEINLNVPLPNSVAGLTIQSIRLGDDDLLVVDSAYTLREAPDFAAALQQMQQVALQMSVFEIDWTAAMSQPGPDAGWAIAQAVAAAAPGAGTQLLLRAEAAEGIFVNGVEADAIPVFAETLPERLRPEEEEAEEEIATGLPADWLEDSPYKVNPGHDISTGENVSANEVFLTSVWVDAPVIAVMGDVLRVDAITQVNLLSDRDSGAAAGEGEGASQTVNAGRIGASVTTDAAPDRSDGVPAHAEIVRIEGDLTLVNTISQHSFSTDFDQAQVSVTAAATEIVMGANSTTNLTEMASYGFTYDMIVVGGDLVDIDAISQTNVLLDDDTVTHEGPAPQVLSADDNLLMNQASITSRGTDTVVEMDEDMRAAGEDLAEGAEHIGSDIADDPLFAGMDALRVLHVEGDLVTMNLIEQVNVLGDADMVHLALEDHLAATTDAVTVATGSNALLNTAAINEIGTDSTILAAGETYSDALIHQAELIDYDAIGDDAAALANEAVAFLASDMIEAPAPVQIAGPELPADLPGAADIMQSVVA